MVYDLGDIGELEHLRKIDGLVEQLLRDHTTGGRIYWASSGQARCNGDGMGYFDELTPETIFIEGFNPMVRRRALASAAERAARVKSKAEVYTPSWVCNLQNNVIDAAWFGRDTGLFNEPDKSDSHRWVTNRQKIIFPDTDGKTWKDYVSSRRLELTCGEAPYLCNRYDAATGEYNMDVRGRIGILDRKLRVVSENVDSPSDWLVWGKVALRTTYGFEWCGDSLFLARVAMLLTFIEHYIDRFGVLMYNRRYRHFLPGAAYIISWNLWQMDGRTFGLPGYTPIVPPARDERALFADDDTYNKIDIPVRQRLCVVKDFLSGIDVVHRQSLSVKSFHDRTAPQITFKSIVDHGRR